MRSRRWVRHLALLAIATVAIAAVAVPAAFADDPVLQCTRCHEYTQKFEVGPVDKDTACATCHTPGLLGTHPYHQPGANCGAYCHSGWGETLFSAVPTSLSSAGSFASATSTDTSPEILHQIHATPRWPSGVNTSVSACSSCHLPAACTSCHEAGTSARHEAHSQTSNTAWTGTVCFGILGEDQTVRSATLQSNYCSTPECHDSASVAGNAPLSKEDFTHVAYPEYGYPEANTVTKTGAWGVMRSTTYTGGQQSMSNSPGATLSLPFTGQRVALVGDRDPYRGRAEIWIDNVYRTTIDCYSPTTKPQQLLWTSPALATGTHTVTVKVLGTRSASSRGTWVAVDCFKAYPTADESIAPWCTDSCHGVHPVPPHTATPGSGDVLIYAAGEHDSAMSGDGTVYVSCSTCHATGLNAVHDNQCFSCHPLPYYTLGTWNGKCQQGGCHVTYHTDSTSHWAVEYDCNKCHDAGWNVPPSSCPKCHATYSPSDSTPPVTTSNAKASYTGAAVIDFSITDSGKVGVGTTYHRLDGGTTQSAEPAVISAPGSHTLQFWSVDQAGNVELPPKTASFTVASDSTPPVTTSNAVSSYWNGATITLNATDTSNQGVKATYYTLNGGPIKTGKTISVPATPGSFPYILRFWSEDWSGNVESTKTASFTVISGTTTIRLVWYNSDITGPPTDPEADAYWEIRRTNSTGYLAASGANGNPGWSGVEDEVVPVSGAVYWVKVWWWDSVDEYYDETVFPSVVATTPGALIRLSY